MPRSIFFHSLRAFDWPKSTRNNTEKINIGNNRSTCRSLRRRATISWLGEGEEGEKYETILDDRDEEISPPTSHLSFIGNPQCDGSILIHHGQDMTPLHLSQMLAQPTFEVSNTNISHDQILVIYSHIDKLLPCVLLTRLREEQTTGNTLDGYSWPATRPEGAFEV